jgi:hypothetical protein
MRHPFKYYLHDDANSLELQSFLKSVAGIDVSDDLMQKIGRPFYEVTLHCELDDETGKIYLLGAEL